MHCPCKELRTLPQRTEDRTVQWSAKNQVLHTSMGDLSMEDLGS
eukprot:COSAG02_NODE_1802_length_10890_cov_10.379205_5_plen_44_part_00